MEKGAVSIYGKYILMRTRALLPDFIQLPGDIPGLVEGVYGETDDLQFNETQRAEYMAAKEERDKETGIRKSHAEAYQISNVITANDTIMGWLDNSIKDDSDKRAEAAVRDGNDSIEVIVLQRREGRICTLPWIENGMEITKGGTDDETARKIASCTVRLPAFYGYEWNIDGTIKELEDAMSAEGLRDEWEGSKWLKGALCLILDEKMETTLRERRLIYNRLLGLADIK
jgi:CRISPR-associated endonuclease/helicase Cas3